MIGPRRLVLTDAQRQQIDQARTVAAAEAEDLAGTGLAGTGSAAVYAIAFGRARGTVATLLGIIDELTGGAS